VAEQGRAPASGGDPLLFAEKLLALLDSGRYTATYKFATLTALIDVCVESVAGDGSPPDQVSARAVGRRVLELFWRHAVPYSADAGERRYLRHSTQRNDLVSLITAFREEHDLRAGVPVESARQRFPEQFAVLESRVVVTVIRMPLPKLQRFRAGPTVHEDRFLYEYGWPDEVPEGRVRAADFDDTLHLRPGVGEWLVRLAGVLRPIIQQRWASFVAERSRDQVEAAWLDDFLFGSSRVGLDRVRAPLLDVQEGACFYCGSRVGPREAQVDHFIPWSRHPDNGLHNLVVAHGRCNGAKRDSLAAVDHLGRWLQRTDLDAISDDLRWPSDAGRTLGSARATYLWLPEGAPLWQGVGLYARADTAAIRRVLLDR
jgi:hypothetical protein